MTPFPTLLTYLYGNAFCFMKFSILTTCLFWSVTANSQPSDKFMNQRDFERAVILYGGSNEENLEGLGCRNKYDKHRPNIDKKYKTECRVKYSSSLDKPFSKFPIVLQFKSTHHYYGEKPMKPEHTRGLYIYRFDAGKLENKGNGVFRLAIADTGKILQVRKGEVVSWSFITSNLENESSHENIPYHEILITPLAAKIHHCNKFDPGNCDPINIKNTVWGLCEGRVKKNDGLGALNDTSVNNFVPMTDTNCQALAIIDDNNSRKTIFKSYKVMGQEKDSFRSIGNQWVIEDNDPPGPYRIEVRISGKLLGTLDFEVVR